MALPPSSPSPALMAANRRLHYLREQHQANKEANQPAHLHAPVDDTLPRLESEPSEESVTVVRLITELPVHLGWESDAITKTIRKSEQQQERIKTKHERFPTGQPAEQSNTRKYLQPSCAKPQGNSVKHYPSIGLAALKAEQASIYRVWLLYRYLDAQGRGWLDVQEVRQQVTETDSKLRLFTWRRLRQVLVQGHDRFWTWDRDNGRLWLFGAARVAAILKVRQLTGKPVAMPLSTITNGIGNFKAHLYGAWHSGRKTNNPISRCAQETITGIPDRTQRHYCNVAGIERESNIVFGYRYTSRNAEEAAWQHSQAVFDFVDSQGKQGRKGARYLAWQLPNTYTPPHQQAPKGRMRKINRKLRGLVTIGAQGNSNEPVEKLYFANGKEAVRMFNRDEGTSKEIYWFVASTKCQHHVWSCFFMA